MLVVIFLRGGPNERRLQLGGEQSSYLDFQFIDAELGRGTGDPTAAGARVTTLPRGSTCQTCATSATSDSSAPGAALLFHHVDFDAAGV